MKGRKRRFLEGRLVFEGGKVGRSLVLAPPGDITMFSVSVFNLGCYFHLESRLREK